MKSRLRRHRLNGSGDMKQRILKAMERLEDIDTRNAAVTQLELITRQLHDEHISTMLVRYGRGLCLLASVFAMRIYRVHVHS